MESEHKGDNKNGGSRKECWIKDVSCSSEGCFCF